MKNISDKEPFDEKRARALIAELQEKIKALQQENDDLKKYIQDIFGDKDKAGMVTEEPANKKITDNVSKYQLEKYMLEKFNKDKTLPIFTGDISNDRVRSLLVEKIKSQLNEIKGQFTESDEVISTVDQINNLLDKLPRKSQRGKSKKRGDL